MLIDPGAGPELTIALGDVMPLFGEQCVEIKIKLSGLPLLQISFLVVVVATFGSLYFGEVLKYPPCSLCWYQRICMYPLSVVFASALWTEDRRHFRYSMPLAIFGFVIASYHNLLYYHFIPDSITPCAQGVSCTTKQIEIFGFLTIPLMSWISFVMLIALGTLDLFARKETHE